MAQTFTKALILKGNSYRQITFRAKPLKTLEHAAHLIDRQTQKGFNHVTQSQPPSTLDAGFAFGVGLILASFNSARYRAASAFSFLLASGLSMTLAKCLSSLWVMLMGMKWRLVDMACAGLGIGSLTLLWACIVEYGGV